MNQPLQQLIDDFRSGYLTRRGVLAKAGALGLSATAVAVLAREAQAQATPEADAQDSGMPANSPAEVIWAAIAGGDWELVDLSLTAAPNYPVAWPDQPQLTVTPILWFEEITDPFGTIIARQGPADVTVYGITEHCATQIDFAPHFIPPPGVSVEGAEGSEMGLKTGEKYELSTLMGPAVVVDTRDLLANNTENGMSAHITRAWLEQWEAQNGEFQPGDVPIWYSEYTDMYYQPFPNGNRMLDRMLWEPLVTKTAPGWVAADPDAMELLHERGVVHVATDGPSFGWTEGGQPTHVAGLQYGMSWTEGVINAGSLPMRGAFFITAPYKVENQAAGLTRAFAIIPAGAAGVADSPPLILD